MQHNGIPVWCDKAVHCCCELAAWVDDLSEHGYTTVAVPTLRHLGGQVYRMAACLDVLVLYPFAGCPGRIARTWPFLLDWSARAYVGLTNRILRHDAETIGATT